MTKITLGKKKICVLFVFLFKSKDTRKSHHGKCPYALGQHASCNLLPCTTISNGLHGGAQFLKKKPARAARSTIAKSGCALEKKSKRRRVRGGARKSAANNQRKTAKEKANSAVVDCQPPALFCFFLAKRLPSLFFFSPAVRWKKGKKKRERGK